MFFRSAEHLDLDDAALRIDCMARVELRKDSFPETISASESLLAYAGCRIAFGGYVVNTLHAIQERAPIIKRTIAKKIPEGGGGLG